MIERLYEAIGGDYLDARSRLMTDSIIEKFARKFPDDPSFRELEAAMKAGDMDKAFKAVHTLKGVALNLSFKKLGESSSALCEKLRHWDKGKCSQEEVSGLYESVIEDYNELVASINSMLV